MITDSPTAELTCKEHLDQFFAANPDSVLQNRSTKALRFLQSDGKPLTGNPQGWAAGIIYALVNQDRQACGVPGLLNSEFAEFFGVSMGTIRKRAASVVGRLSI